MSGPYCLTFKSALYSENVRSFRTIASNPALLKILGKICPSIGLIINPTNCWVIKVSLKLGNTIAQQKLLLAQQLGKLMCQLLGIIICSFVGWVENGLIVEHYALPIKWENLPNIIPTRFSIVSECMNNIKHHTCLS